MQKINIEFLRKNQRERRSYGQSGAKEEEGRGAEYEEICLETVGDREVSGMMAEEKGQLGAFSASLSSQAFTPASVFWVFI